MSLVLCNLCNNVIIVNIIMVLEKDSSSIIRDV